MANRILFALILAAPLVAGGCAARSREVVVKVPSFYDFSSSRGSLYVVADPYVEPDKSRYIFDASFARKGYFPIHLIFQNFGSQSYSLESATVELHYEDGSRGGAVPLESLPERAKSHPLARAFGSEVLGGKVGPAETRSGFMFFSFGRTGRSSDVASLDVRGLVEEGTGNRFDLAIPLQRSS